MPPRTRAEAERAFEEISRLESNIKRQDSGLDQAAKYIKWLYGFGGVIAVCASTSGVALFKIDQIKFAIEKLEAQSEHSRNLDDDQARRIQANETRIDANREERKSQITAMEVQILDLLSRKKEHDIMWGMKENGRSNKEEYMRINHIAAPEIPEK